MRNWLSATSNPDEVGVTAPGINAKESTIFEDNAVVSSAIILNTNI